VPELGPLEKKARNFQSPEFSAEKEGDNLEGPSTLEEAQQSEN